MSISGIEEALEPFRVARLRVLLRPEGQLLLPPNAGSSVRGALAGAVKDLVCVRRERQVCEGCDQAAACAYPYLFETTPPPGTLAVRGFETFPRPYVISAANGLRDNPSADREIGLTLVGKAIQYFPYLALGLRELETRGLGRGRGRVELARVEALNLAGSRQIVYEGGTLYGADFSLSGADILYLFPNLEPKREVRLRFLSPTTLNVNKRPADRFEFALVVRALLRRISYLARGHCGYEMNLDYGAIIARAETASIQKHQLRQVDWERHSRRQDRRVPMGGLIGDVDYADVASEMLPLLLLGSLVHIGDNCAFGMGRFILSVRSAGAENWMPAGWEFPGEAPRT